MRGRHVAGLVLLVLIAWSLQWSLPTGELRDYGSFVASGRAGANGQNPYGIHPLTFHVVLPGFDVWNPNLNPPVSIPVFAQFDRLHPQHGFRVWWSISVLCYLGTVCLLARRYGAGPAALLVLWALALAGFWDTLALGQIYLPLVLAATASWLLLERGHATAAGVLMGIVVAVKPNFGVWPAVLLLAGHWRAPAAAAATAVALSLLPLVTHGPTIYAQWVELILSDRNRAAFLTNASLPGLAQRAGAGILGTVGSAAILLGLAAWAIRRRLPVLAASTLGILGGIVASPIAWVHYTLFLVPAFFAFRLSPPLLAAAGLMVVPVPILLRYLDAPVWQQVTIGSAYNWAVLLASAGFAAAVVRRDASNLASDVNRPTASDLTIVFYDGVCGLCHRLVHFLVSRDRGARLRFAPLQGELARRELIPAGHDPADLDSALVLVHAGTPGQHVLARSRAILYAVAQVGGVWGTLAAAAGMLPQALTDALYTFIARRRYRLFGRFDACPLPRPEWRSRFVDGVPVDR